MFGRSRRGVAAFQYHFTLIVAKEKKHLHYSRRATQSSNTIETCLTHCLYCLTEHKSCTPQYKWKNAHADTRMLAYTPLSQSVITEHTYAHAHIHTHSHTPL